MLLFFAVMVRVGAHTDPNPNPEPNPNRNVQVWIEASRMACEEKCVSSWVYVYVIM